MTREDDVTQRGKGGLETSDKVNVTEACNPLSFSSLILRPHTYPRGRRAQGTFSNMWNSLP